MGGKLDIQIVRVLRQAIEHVENALHLLDGSNASRDIGAHLDMALHRLREEQANISAAVSDVGGQGRSFASGSADSAGTAKQA